MDLLFVNYFCSLLLISRFLKVLIHPFLFGSALISMLLFTDSPFKEKYIQTQNNRGKWKNSIELHKEKISLILESEKTSLGSGIWQYT